MKKTDYWLYIIQNLFDEKYVTGTTAELKNWGI